MYAGEGLIARSFDPFAVHHTVRAARSLEQQTQIETFIFATDIPSICELRDIGGKDLTVVRIDRSVVIRIDQLHIAGMKIGHTARVRFIFGTVLFQLLFVSDQTVCLINIESVQWRTDRLDIITADILVIAAAVDPFVLVISQVERGVERKLSERLTETDHGFYT